MERESFEDDEVAAYLNKHFIAIKVDREERPDIDAVYMQVCQALTGSGGWPLTVFLTPDKTAFYAGTYFPKRSQYGMPGLMDVLSSVVKLWKTDKKKLVRQGAEILKRLEKEERQTPELLTRNDVLTAADIFRQSFDDKYGGFGKAPKFPTPHSLLFLLRYYYHERDDHTLEMVLKTLRGMYRGGLFDHIGGGFSRYSTDRKWLVPHFEKMLYDNALLTLAYLEAYQLTGEKLFRTVAEKTMLYVRREMTDPEGGFYSAQDADIEGEEGGFYVFRPETIREVLEEDDVEFFCRWFGIDEAGNFEGESIPNLIDNDDYDSPDPRLDSMLDIMYAYRSTRAKLFKDDKILTSWNALMIAAYAKAYQTLRTESYRMAAERAALFLQRQLTRPDGSLFVRYRDGEAAGMGYLEDYAYAAWAMLALYEATFDPSWLDSALTYAETMCRLFEDKINGGFFLYADDGEQLMLRPKETYDGALPSGNSVAAYVLVQLAALTADEKWEARAHRQMSFMAGPIKEYPAGRCFGLMAAMLKLYPSREVVSAVGSEEELNRLAEKLARVYMPNVAMLVKTKENEAQLNAAVPFVRAYLILDKKSNFYVCENKTCGVPITDMDELIKNLTAGEKLTAQ